MYRCIVTPVDGSAFGEHALPYAAAIAKRSGATLHLAHVHVPLITPTGAEAVAFRGSWNEATREQERGYLDGLVERLAATYDVQVDSVLIEGSVAPALERYARDCGASLLVMSTHAHTRLSRLWHHGVAEHLARELPVPVLLIRPEDEDAEPDLSLEPEFRHILVPLDGSSYAEAMLEHAVAFGRSFRARYTLLRVVKSEVTVGYTLLAQDGHVNHHRLGREQLAALQYLNAQAERLRAGGLEVRTHVLVSQAPAAAILDYIRSATSPPAGPIDAVAMETHPHRPVARILGAHTADRVLRDTPVPVLLFEPPLATATPRESAATATIQA